MNTSTVKPVYNDPRDPKFVAVVDTWSLVKGSLCYKKWKWDPKIVVDVGRRLLFGGGR